MHISICVLAEKKNLFDLATIRVPPRKRWSGLLAEITRCTSAPDSPTALCFLLVAQSHILPGAVFIN